jgi:hypothetical protein
VGSLLSRKATMPLETATSTQLPLSPEYEDLTHRRSVLGLHVMYSGFTVYTNSLRASLIRARDLLTLLAATLSLRNKVVYASISAGSS